MPFLKLPQIPKFGPKLDLESKLTLAIISSFAFGIILLLSIFDRAGDFGSMIGSLMINIFGRAAVILPFLFFYAGFIFIKLQKNIELAEDIDSRLVWGLIFELGFITGFLNVIFDVKTLGQIRGGGGLVGYLFYPLLLSGLGTIAGSVVLFAMGFFGFFLTSKLSFNRFTEIIKESVKNPGKFWELIPDIFEVFSLSGKSTEDKEELTSLNSHLDKKAADKIQTPKPAETIPVVDIIQPRPIDEQVDPRMAVLVPDSPKKSTSKAVWKRPPFDILKENFTQADPGNIENNKKIIKETLGNFGIEVQMADVVTGPTISQYTLKPASGVKLSVIDSLQRDLALALAATSMRLEAPIPGKSLVGIEIPNQTKAMVGLRDLLQTKKFRDFKDDLPIPIGLDVAGNNLIYGVSKMPHLLVAGSTGSGKSVWINSMLVSLIYRYLPEDLQLILIDMKRVELKLYEGLPHLLSKVITEVDKAINALKWTVLEMDRRYKLLEEVGKRNIKDYNEFVKTTKIPDMDLAPLPYLVFVIDELGDLMILAKNEVEPIIVRLTQMSRAVGIHLVLGTQRPDTQVVTGLIKANIPSRIAFAVASQIDSRVILDQMGAEKLIGQGDGLFMSPSTIRPVRFQGPNADELEVRKCVSFWRDQLENSDLQTNLDNSVTETPKTKIVVPGYVSSDNSAEDEDIFEKCRVYVISQQSASTSMLQTAFGIGYPKARKIIDSLYQDGIVGPPNGSKAREVYITEA